jgi:hypothetical protein
VPSDMIRIGVFGYKKLTHRVKRQIGFYGYSCISVKKLPNLEIPDVLSIN